MTRLIDALRDRRPSWPAVLLFTALLAQAPHAAAVFIRIAPHGAQWEVATSFVGAWVYAIALEGATAYFVWRSKLRWAIAFAVFSVAHNVAYYMPEAWTFDVYGATLTVRYVFSALLISASLPIAIAAFSHVQAQNESGGATPEKPAEPPATANGTAAPASTRLATPSAISGHPGDTATVEHVGQTDVLAPPPPATPAPVTLQAIAQRSSGDIAKMLGVSRQAVDGWQRRGTLETNIARRLPDVAAPHQNGNGGTHA